MADREVTIKISAKNLTEAEFRKVRQGLGGIGSSATGAKQKTSGLQRAFSSFGKAAPGALKAVTIAAAAAGAAIVGIATAVVKLGERGAVIGDVKEAFDKLSVSSGTTGAVMLGALQQGVKGTITNFELMKVANKALGAGLLDSAGDARTMAEGARLLAKRTGGDTVQAFETLVTSMASGRTAQLKQLGLFVDNKQAVEDYAKATGKTVSQMNDADRATALQVATLAALRGELASNAPPLADFGELIGQGKVAVGNLVDGLALMISQSPPLLAGMAAVKDVIGQAFGGDQEGLILGIVNAIEKAAIVVLTFAETGISAAKFLYQGFAGIKLLVMGIGVAFTTLSGTVLGFVAQTLEAAASVPVLGNAFKLQAIAARTASDAVTGVDTALKAEIAETTAAALGNDAFSQTLNTVGAAVTAVKDSVVNAGLSQRELNAATAEGTTAIATFATANVDAAQPIKDSVKDWGEKFLQNLTDTKTETEQWTLDEQQFFQDLAGEQGVKGFVTAVEGAGTLVAFQTQAMADSFAFFGIQTKDELKTTYEAAKKHFENIKKSGTTSAKELQTAWEAVEKAKRTASGETESFTTTSNASILTGTTAMLQQLGTKNKAAAVASAIIGTAQAVVQALRSGPPPGSWILAAINAAMGAMQIAAIKSQKAYATGTAGLDYQQFGTSTPARLHGKEAVIPQGGGHQLAREIAGAMDRGQRPDAQLAELREIRSSLAELRGLPRSIQRAVRDGVLLAS